MAWKKEYLLKPKKKKVRHLADWPPILNASQAIIKSMVGSDGSGVFNLDSVLKATPYSDQRATITRYLQEMGILVRGQRMASGTYDWTLKPRKVGVIDVRKARASRKPNKAQPIKTSMTKVTTRPVLTVKKSLPPAETVPMLLEVFESLRKENSDLEAQVKKLEARIAELEAHGVNPETAERVSKLICELTNPLKS